MSDIDKKFTEIYEKIRIVSEINVNSNEYLRVPKSLIDSIEEEFVPLVDKIMGTDFWESGDYHRQGFIGRYISDTNLHPDMGRVYSVLHRLDDEYQLWQQPYYTHQSNDGKINMSDFKCINLDHPELIQKLRSDTISDVLKSD